MRLQKAIEVLTEEIDNITLSPDPDVPAALKLGIEALKAIKDCRYYPLPSSLKHLPGESYIPESIGKLPSDEDV